MGGMRLAVWLGDQRLLVDCLALDLAPAWPAAAFKGVCGDWVLLYTGILEVWAAHGLAWLLERELALAMGPCASIIDFKGSVVSRCHGWKFPFCPVWFTPLSVLCSIFRAVSQSRHYIHVSLSHS